MNKEVKKLTLRECDLLNEMKNRCLNGGQYIDEKAKEKFEMLCHLEDFCIQYYQLLEYINQLETKQMDIKTDWFRVDRNTEAIQLYSFINDYLTFNEVVELYRLLKYKMDYHVDLKKVDEYMEEYENN